MTEKKIYKIVYNREECIGFGGCAAASQFFEMVSDKKADLVNGKKNKEGLWELKITEEELAKTKDAAEICPVNIIKVFNIETNEQIV